MASERRGRTRQAMLQRGFRSMGIEGFIPLPFLCLKPPPPSALLFLFYFSFLFASFPCFCFITLLPLSCRKPNTSPSIMIPLYFFPLYFSFPLSLPYYLFFLFLFFCFSFFLPFLCLPLFSSCLYKDQLHNTRAFLILLSCPFFPNFESRPFPFFSAHTTDNPLHFLGLL